jgi:hypothetical protein
MPALKKMKFLKNLNVPWGPRSRASKRKLGEEETDKENVSHLHYALKHAN